jgi:heme/copper-type cytochrome/quinol oxidase subunit 3
LGLFRNAIDGLVLTILLGFFFILLQGLEYYESTFNLFDGAYTCAFFLLTGLHGCHVLAGATFLTVCLVRLLQRHYLTTHYLGFIFAI